MKRTHHCNQLRLEHVGETATLCGWVHSRRDLGGVLFVDVRDREGRTQTVFDPARVDREIFDRASSLHSESVVALRGRIRRRPEGTLNPRIATGEVELVVEQMEVVNDSEVLPFPIDNPEEAAKVHEELRLRYRYLDLRRPEIQRNLRLRSKAATAVRTYLDGEGFCEVETPILFKSTPEGAREFLVPSRVHPGEYYALPQSPQQFKQILMVAGMDRYFQLARCFRDEDLRADRQPEFTQIDIEMSFVGREEVYRLVEGLMEAVWLQAAGIRLKTPFARMTYRESMDRYGTDKPDTRYGLELADLTGVFGESGFKVFSQAVARGGVVKALNAKGCADATQGQMETLAQLAADAGAKGLAWIKCEGGEWKSPIVKFFGPGEREALQQRLSVQEGDLILFAADQWLSACEILGRLRLQCASLQRERKLLEPEEGRFDFLWITDFPLLSFDREQNRWYSSHHPFTAPVEEDVPMLESSPREVRGQHYDLVVNGVELGGGSIRIHRPDLQRAIFEKVLGLSEHVVQERFGYLLDAFRYGAPPHGGIALGFDRMAALLAGVESIREVIAFPKTAKAADLLSGSPSAVEPRQLRDLHIQEARPRPRRAAAGRESG